MTSPEPRPPGCWISTTEGLAAAAALSTASSRAVGDVPTAPEEPPAAAPVGGVAVAAGLSGADVDDADPGTVQPVRTIAVMRPTRRVGTARGRARARSMFGPRSIRRSLDG